MNDLFIFNSLTDFVVKAGSAAAATSLAGLIRMRERLSKLESKVESLDHTIEEKKVAMAAMSRGQAEHAERLAVIETVIEELGKIAPSLQSIATVTTKMDVLIAHMERRINLLEEHLLNARKH
jgi:hypothetical protein